MLADTKEIGALQVIRQFVVIGPQTGCIDGDVERALGRVLEICGRFDLEFFEASCMRCAIRFAANEGNFGTFFDESMATMPARPHKGRPALTLSYQLPLRLG